MAKWSVVVLAAGVGKRMRSQVPKVLQEQPLGTGHALAQARPHLEAQSRLGWGTRAGHFSYLGDATIGADVKVGAVTITCNYDGRRHHPTRIGAGVFIGRAATP